MHNHHEGPQSEPQDWTRRTSDSRGVRHPVWIVGDESFDDHWFVYAFVIVLGDHAPIRQLLPRMRHWLRQHQDQWGKKVVARLNNEPKDARLAHVRSLHRHSHRKLPWDHELALLSELLDPHQGQVLGIVFRMRLTRIEEATTAWGVESL